MVSDLKKVLACVGLGLMVQGCETSELISKANPVNWFEDDEKTEEAETKPVPGEEGEYPAIGSVPERPETPDIKEEYEELKSGLIADKENARHTDQVIRSGAFPETSLQGSTANLARQPGETPQEPPVAASVKPAPAEAKISAAPEVTQPARETPKPAPSAEPLVAKSEPQQAQTPPPSPVPATNNGQGQSSQTATQQAPQPEAAAAGEHVANIYFGDGATQLSGHDRDVVGQIAALYQQKGGKGIKVVGHSSSSAGTKDKTRAGLVNFKVSLDRASAVAAELVRRGIPKTAIQVDARGAAQPLYTENTKQAQAYNRRAEVFILYK